MIIETCVLFAVPKLLEAGPADGLHALYTVQDAGEVQAPLLGVVHCDDDDLCSDSLRSLFFIKQIRFRKCSISSSNKTSSEDRGLLTRQK
jgi:hypothetical protein